MLKLKVREMVSKEQFVSRLMTKSVKLKLLAYGKKKFPERELAKVAAKVLSEGGEMSADLVNRTKAEIALFNEENDFFKVFEYDVELSKANFLKVIKAFFAAGPKIYKVRGYHTHNGTMFGYEFRKNQYGNILGRLIVTNRKGELFIYRDGNKRFSSRSTIKIKV